MTCEQKMSNGAGGRCPYEATYAVHWPGRTIVVCAQHEQLARKVAGALGFDLVATPIEPHPVVASESTVPGY